MQLLSVVHEMRRFQCFSEGLEESLDVNYPMCTKNELEGNQASYEITCSPREDTRIRLLEDDWEHSTSESQVRCQQKKSDCRSSSISKGRDCDKTTTLGCCKTTCSPTDFCNKGSPVSVHLLTMSSVLGLALLN